MCHLSTHVPQGVVLATQLVIIQNFHHIVKATHILQRLLSNVYIIFIPDEIPVIIMPLFKCYWKDTLRGKALMVISLFRDDYTSNEVWEMKRMFFS